MEDNLWIYYLALASIFLTIVFIVIFVVLLNNFDKKFNSYLTSTSEKNKIIKNQLSLITDSIFMLYSTLQPSCTAVLNKYMSEGTELLKDMHRCSHIGNNSKCYGDKCCCCCEHQGVLYALNSQEELRSIAILCNVGNIDVVTTEHGTCVLHDTKKVE